MNGESAPKLRVALLTTAVAPYRVSLFRALAERFDLLIVQSKTEGNRQWDDSMVPGARMKTVAGLTLKWKQVSNRGRVVEERYTHINPGYITALLSFRPDAILTKEMGFRSLVGLIYGLLFRVPVWIWWAGGIHSNLQFGNSLPQRLTRRFLFVKIARHWISHGAVSTEYLTSLGVNPHSICEIQQTVDSTLFSQKGVHYPLQSARPRVLCVSRLVGLKGIEQLLDVVAKLQHDGHEFSLVLVGDGPEAENVTATIERLKISGVEWLPWIEPDDMPSVYRACDFMVFPTLVDVWGLVVNEALLCGLPVLSSVYAGCTQELIPDESRFDPLNAEDFINAMRRGLSGDITSPDIARLQPLNDVADRISNAVMQELPSHKRSSP